NFAGGEREVQVGPLRHYANQQFHGDLVLPDFVIANPGLARSCTDTRSKDAYCRRLTRAVRASQTKNLPRADFQREAVERGNLRLRLLGAFCVGASYKASRRA